MMEILAVTSPFTMADICHTLTIAAPRARVFRAVATPEGLQQWWTRRSYGRAQQGGEIRLEFGPGHEWGAVFRRHAAPDEVEIEVTEADDEWRGARIAVSFDDHEDGTRVRFRHHTNWTDRDENYAVATYCWGRYLQLLKRHLETGDTVPFGSR